MSILDLPRIHFRGTAIVNVPTGNNNNYGAIDLATNTPYMDGKKVAPGCDPTTFYRRMLEVGPRYNGAGQYAEDGELSKAAGWNFEGSSHFFWDARIVSAQRSAFAFDADDPLLGRPIELFGHYNEYLGTTANRARMIDADCASNWTTQIYAGQLAFGRLGPSHEVPNLLSAPIDCIHHSRFLRFDHILDLAPHCNNPEYSGAAILQFTLAKASLLFGADAGASPVLSALRAALDAPEALGLVVQYALYNMSTTSQPNTPGVVDLAGTIGVWREGELRTYPAGRLLTPRRASSAGQPRIGPVMVQLSEDRASFNMPIAVPARGRKAKLEPGDGPTHPLGPKCSFGSLELREKGSHRLLARIPEEAYAWEAHRRGSGLIDVPLEGGKDALEHAAACGLYLEGTAPGGERAVLLEEEEINLQVDRANFYLEAPDRRRGRIFPVSIEIRSYVRGQPAKVAGIHLHQFYNPRGFPQLRYEFEAEPANAGRVFEFPKSRDVTLALVRPGRMQEGEAPEQDDPGGFAPSCVIETDESGRGFVTLRGERSGTAKVLLKVGEERCPIPLAEGAEREAEHNYDNEDRLQFWAGAGSFSFRVLPDDWHLWDAPASEVDYAFLYEHVLAYYELIYPFMRRMVFSLADRSKCETYARLMWQMCDPQNQDKSYYMPPTRELSLPKANLFLKYLKNVERVGYVPPKQTSTKGTHRFISSREQLVRALKDAVQLELSLMVQYIYAGYSIPNYATGLEYVKQGFWTEQQLRLAVGDGAGGLDQGFRGVILDVAHEEMIHFLIVNNLLMAIGEPFYVTAPDFASVKRFFPVDAEFALTPFSLATIERFIQFEWPDYFENEIHTGSGTRSSFVESVHGYGSVSELYRQIREAFESLPDLIMVEKGRGGGEHHLFLHEEVNRRHPDYQLRIDDVESALFGIHLITQQGEGVSPESPLYDRSHFSRFRRIAMDLAIQQGLGAGDPFRPPWNPAYPAVRNPTLRRRDFTANLITVLETRSAMMLFDGCYELMLQLMVQHFGEAATASLRRSKLMNASIDVMTGLVRPLGVMLMSMPSGKKGRTAGPSFELDHVPASISVPKVAYKVISQKFKRLHDLALTIPPVSEAVRGILAGYAAEFASMAERS